MRVVRFIRNIDISNDVLQGGNSAGSYGVSTRLAIVSNMSKITYSRQEKSSSP